MLLVELIHYNLETKIMRMAMPQIKSRVLSKLKVSPTGQTALFSEHALPKFPATRYQGSKRKILPELATAFRNLTFHTVLDLYSGSGVVSLLLRYLGKQVHANDYLLFNQSVARLFLTANDSTFKNLSFREDLGELLSPRSSPGPGLVHEHYRGIFFLDHENEEIDRFCHNVSQINSLHRDLYVYAVGQALMKKRPYNLFHRANLQMRQRDVKRSFGNAVTWKTSILDHASKAIEELRRFPFDDCPRGKVFGESTEDLSTLSNRYDLVYLDPPYLNSAGVGVDYSDFYGFLDGLCNYRLFESGDLRFAHKPIHRRTSNWLNPVSALEELSAICSKWTSSIIFLSYRSDGLPNPGETVEVLSQRGRKVEQHTCGEYKYALSRTNSNEELFLVSTP